MSTKNEERKRKCEIGGKTRRVNVGEVELHSRMRLLTNVLQGCD